MYDDQTPPTVRAHINKNAEEVNPDDDFLGNDSSDDEAENIPREEPFT